MNLVIHDFLTHLEALTEIDDLLELSLLILSMIILVSTIDWLFGWVNAKLNDNVQFISGTALYGIIKKMMYFTTLVIFLITSLIILPQTLAYTSIITLYTGYLISEIWSILGHLGLADDNKKNELFIDYVKNVFLKDKGE